MLGNEVILAQRRDCWRHLLLTARELRHTRKTFLYTLQEYTQTGFSPSAAAALRILAFCRAILPFMLPRVL